nr:MAG TPA: hypothetical protein [Caudoviricetes sp.]
MLNISYLVSHLDLRTKASEKDRLDELSVLFTKVVVDKHGLNCVAIYLHTCDPRAIVSDRVRSLDDQTSELKEDLGRFRRNVNNGGGRPSIKKFDRKLRLRLRSDDPTILEIDPNSVRFVVLDYVTNGPLSDSQKILVNRLFTEGISVKSCSSLLEFFLRVFGNSCH